MSHRHPYTCPRCGYSTKKKFNMIVHLTRLKKPCPATEEYVELTHEVIDFILVNRVYHAPKQAPQQIIINQTNNNQQINNFLGDIGDIEQLQDLLVQHRCPDTKTVTLSDFNIQCIEE